MRLFVDCWRQSLAAVALAAVLGPASGDVSRTLAAEGEHDVPRIKLEREGGERPDAKPAREARKEAAERKSEARGQRERARERAREGGEQRDAQARELAERRAKLLEQAAEIRRKLQSLKPDQGADELKSALHRIEGQLRDLPQHFPRPERVRARLEDVRAAQRRAQEAGRADEAERLGREVHELMRMLEQGAGDRPADRPAGEEIQRRLHHVRAAVENLRAAGLNEQAEALARDAERLVRGQRAARPDGARDVPAPGPQLERAVHELHGQVQELRQQMEAIRQHLKALGEKR